MIIQSRKKNYRRTAVHLLFINPQGNFDPADSFLTEHPDFGGQLVYVKEVAQALVKLGHKVDIATRLIIDDAWPQFSEPEDSYPGFENDLRILRFPCGGDKFLEKEKLWPYLDEFVNSLAVFYGNELPNAATAHYADGGYCAFKLKLKTGIPYTFTGHSLGAQKLDKLGTTIRNWGEMDKKFNFSRRLAAENISMMHASKIIVSTNQEREEQYGHELYSTSVDPLDNNRFAVTPPGVNTEIFSTKKSQLDGRIESELDIRFGDDPRPTIVISSRLDEKKNIIGVVKAYANSKNLQNKANLGLCIRGIRHPEDEIVKLGKEEQRVLRDILTVAKTANIRRDIYFLDIRSQIELSATYRYFAAKGSVFALTSLYEPFGLAPIEAAAAGLAAVATNKGGPTEIFADGSGVLVDPFNPTDIARGLLEGLTNHSALAQAAISRVKNLYTWKKTAEGYITAIDGIKPTAEVSGSPEVFDIDLSDQIRAYLSGQKDE